MSFAALGCLNFFINSILWSQDAIYRDPVWCDISTKFIVGLSVAIPAASLCINRRLYNIASGNSGVVTKGEKARAVKVDLAIGLGIPLLAMILHYCVQGHRFNIFEDVGCMPDTYNGLPSYFLVFSWPLILSTISACYCILTLRAFMKRRAEFKELLSAHNNLNSSRYFRLMALAGIELVCGIPLSSFSLYLNSQAGLRPWKGWADVHSNFSRVILVPSIQWRSDYWNAVALEMTRWSPVVCALIFFMFFGFADEARKHYASYYQTVAKKVGLSTGGSTTTGLTSSNGGKKWNYGQSSNGKGTTTLPLPIYVRQETVSKRDSFDSIDEKDLTASFTDFSGMLDFKTDEKPSSSNSSTSSITNSPPAVPAPALSPTSPRQSLHIPPITISGPHRDSIATV